MYVDGAAPPAPRLAEQFTSPSRDALRDSERQHPPDVADDHTPQDAKPPSTPHEPQTDNFFAAAAAAAEEEEEEEEDAVTAAAVGPAAADRPAASAEGAGPGIKGTKRSLQHRGGGSGDGGDDAAAGPPVKRPGAPLKAISVCCSPPPPELVAAKRLRELDRRAGSRGGGRGGAAGDGSSKRGRGAAGEGSGSPADSPDGADSDAEEAGPAEPGHERGGGVQRRVTTYGTFHPDRYLDGEDCIEFQGSFISRSKFEKLGGSLMAKWYRSIRVVTTDEPLGTWLSRRGLPVLKGKPRNRRAAGGANGGAGAGAVDEQPGKSAAAAAGRGPKGAAAANTSSATGTKQAGPSSAGDRTGPQASGGIGGAAAAAAESADKLDAEAAVAAAKPPTPTPRSSGAAVAVATGTAEAAGASFVGAETRPGPRSRYITRGAAATAVGVAALSPTPLRSAGDVSGPAAGETLTAAAAAGPAAAAAAKKNGCEPPGDLGGSGGPCWSGRPGLPQSICPGPTVYDNDNAVRRTRLIQQRGSTSTSSPVSLEELRQISGTSYGKVPVAAPAAAAPAPAAAAAAAASAIVVTAAAGSEGAMPAAAVLAPALMPSGTNGESGHGDDSGGVGGNDAAGGGGTVGPGAGTVGPDVGGLAPPDSQISSDVRDASWLRWAWSGYGDGQEGSSPAPPAPAAAGCCLVGLRPGLPALSANTRPAPQQLHASLPGAIDTQLPYRVSAGAAAAASLAGGLPDEALASAGRLPPDARLQGPAAAADSAAIPPQPQPHHPFPPPQSDYGPLLPLFDQPLYGRDSAPWSSAAPPPDASEHALSYDGGSAGSGAGGCHGWPLHQQQQCALGPSPERPGPLLGLGAPSAAAVTSPRGLRPNRIELVKLELLRGARGGGGAAAAGAAAAATAPGAQVHDLLQQPGGAILLGRSLSSSFEARVEHLLRGGGGGGGSAATAAAARPVGWSLGQVAGAAAATGVGTAAGGASGDLEGDRLAFSLSGVGAAATATAWSLDGHGQGWGQMYGHEAMSYDASAVQKLAPGFQQAQAVGLLACSRVTAPEALSWRRPMGHSHPF